jgi:chromosome partitioning protein
MITVVGNLKGGSGKSTVTFNLAVWLATTGKSIELYDLDPQCTLGDVLQVRKEEGFEPELKVHRYLRPAQKLAELNPQTEILIDVGTANMTGMKRAIAIADRIIVPVPPSQADIWSTQRFLYLIASEKRDKPLEVTAFINRADTHNGVHESDEAEAALQALPGIKVLPIRLSQRISYRRSFSEGLAVFELEPSGKAALEFKKFAELLYSKP